MLSGEEKTLSCLRCGCHGVVNIETDTQNLSIMKSSSCTCQGCLNGCIYHNIRKCMTCTELYKLIWSNIQNKYSYQCPNDCEIQFHCKRLSQIHSKNVNNALPPWNRTLLHSAVQTCDVVLVWELLLKGANPFSPDYRGITPVDLAWSMDRSLNVSSRSGMRKKSYSDRLHEIIELFPDQKNECAPALDFILPSPMARRVLSEGTHHKPKIDNYSFPVPPEVVRSVTSPGRSDSAFQEFNLQPMKESVSRSNAEKTSHHLEEGTQIYTPLTLIRLTSEADGVAATSNLLEEETDLGFSLFGDESDDLSNLMAKVHVADIPSQSATDSQTEMKLGEITQPLESINSSAERPNELLDWKIKELIQAVISDSDIEEKMDFREGIYTCTACMEEITASALGYSCPILGCPGTLCKECFVRSAYSIISSARYAVPVLRCPGGCMHRIPTKVWRGVLMTERPDTPIRDMDESSLYSDAGSILYQKYCNNAKALMKLRCGCCHLTCDLFYDEDTGHSIPTTPEERLAILEGILGPLTKLDQLFFLRTWLLFNKGKLSTDTLVAIFSDIFGQFLVDDEKEQANNGIYNTLEHYVKPSILLFCDVERRLCAQLGFYREYPKILTVCCYEPHCFMCKVYGHHEDISCESKQQEEVGIGVQFCPACGVPTLRTEGCDHIVCVCGMEWEWENQYENDF